MLVGIIHKGSGIGDSLFSYIATRVRAADLGVTYGFVGSEHFKGHSFMTLDWGKPIEMKHHIEYPAGKLVIDDPHNLFVINKPYYDPEFDFIEDGTVIDGYGAQDIRYFEYRLSEIREWLKVEPLEMPENICVINFRGGEFTAFPELFLTKDYWDQAIKMVRDKYRDRYIDRASDIVFQVHTDDPITAKQFFPKFEIIQDIGLNWRSVRYAKHLILANSAFGIIPALLNENAQEVIAPRYHARRNIKEWSMPSNYYRKFLYI